MAKTTKKKEAALPKLTPLDQALRDVHERPYFVFDAGGGSDEFADSEKEAMERAKDAMEQLDNTDLSHIVIYKAIAVVRRISSPLEVVK